jgi:hypothetical protein
MHLLKYFGNKIGFVSVNLYIPCALGPVDPSAPIKFLSRGKGNQIPIDTERGVNRYQVQFKTFFNLYLNHSNISNEK